MKKVLIIEDDQLVANIYSNKFTVDHFKVETATDGSAGFDLVGSFCPDVVLLDLMLPKVSGLDLLRKIRQQPGLERLPIIVFSNTYLSNMVQEAWKAGATKCLSKANCTPKQVIDVVRGLLSQAPTQPPTEPAASGQREPARSVANEAQSPEISTEADSDEAFQAELRRTFVQGLPAAIASARAYLQEIIRTQAESERVHLLQELYRRIHTLTGNAGIAGLASIAQLADALEALLKELYEKPKSVTPSTLRTLASSIDFLAVLMEQAARPGGDGNALPSKPAILVVDDEAISRRAVLYALEKAKLPATSLDNPEAALQMLTERKFDLIFLDVDMPGMNGFELCTKLRTTHRNRSTPVVFVTSLSGFESRANSTMSGGNDLIAKPFLFVELAVKALLFLMRSHLGAAK